MGKKPKRNKNDSTATASTAVSESVHRISVSAVPGSSSTAVVSVDPDGGGVRVRLAAAPRDGEANAELVRFIASVIGVRRSDVSLVAGHRSRSKTVEIRGDAGVKAEDLLQRLRATLAE